jgi:diguanylate cyclase (GGDEF)-like protein/PAS domain S-box-containing protein/putative nucleotidyltransferase with HDIG domain
MDEKLKDLAQEFLDNLSEAVFIANVESGNIVYANRSASELTGYSQEELMNFHFTQLHPEEEKEYYKKKFQEHVKMRNAIDFESEIIRKNGERKHVFISAKVVELNEEKYIAGIFHDMALFKLEEGVEEKSKIGFRKLRDLLFKKTFYLDPLTKIYNYRYLLQKLRRELELAKRGRNKLSGLLLDIDNFQFINDTYGYIEGDRIIKNISELLKNYIRKTDIVGRYADDSFLVILPQTDKKGGYHLASRIHTAITGIKAKSGEHEISLTVTISVVTYPEDSVSTMNEFLARLENLLNKAKEGGGNTIYVAQWDKLPDYDYIPKTNMVKDFQSTLYGLSKKLHSTILETVFALANAVKAKDAYTKEHSEKIAYYATLTAEEMNLPKEEIENIKIGAILHDIGKIGISDKILNKPSSLTKEERECVSLHPEIGANIIKTIKFLREVVPIVLYHHERFDGKGNHWGVKGRDIPIGARIVSVIDVYHALISDRPYRKALPQQEALKILEEEKGKKFDPEIVDAFFRVLEREKNLKGS